MFLHSLGVKSNRSLTNYEREVFLEVCKTHYAGVWALVIYYCGLRPGETSALVWGDIDFEKKLLNVNTAMESSTRKIKTPKTTAGIRQIPIPDELNDKLIKLQKTPREHVFMVSTGKPCKDDSLCLWWRSIKREMDIKMGAVVYRNKIIESKIDPDMTAYYLRHTFCTDLQIMGVPLNVAKYLMGHEDVRTTANIYGHQTEEQTETARQKMNEYHKN